MLRLDDSPTQEAVFQSWHANPRWNPAAAASRLPEDWSDFLAHHWACIMELQKGQREKAYDQIVATLQPFIKVGGRRWLCRVLGLVHGRTCGR